MYFDSDEGGRQLAQFGNDSPGFMELASHWALWKRIKKFNLSHLLSLFTNRPLVFVFDLLFECGCLSFSPQLRRGQRDRRTVGISIGNPQVGAANTGQ